MKASVIGLLCSLLLLSQMSCGEKRSEPLATTAIFEIPTLLEQQQHVLIRSDINHDSVDDAVVIVRDSTVRSHRRDSVHVFMWDASHKNFAQTCCFSVDDFARAQCNDFRPGAAQELVIFTDGGGSSATATRGVVLFQFMNSCFSEYLRIDHGAPTMEQVDSTTVFVQHDEFASFFSRSDAVDYADSVIVPYASSSTATLLVQQRYLDSYAKAQQATLDSVITNTLHRARSERVAYEAAVRRVMALRKLHRDSEAAQTVILVKRRVQGLSQSAKDALQELLDSPM